MVDSTGKPDSGIMDLSLFWLGSVSECMDVVATEGQPGNGTKTLFRGQYGVLTLYSKVSAKFKIANKTAEYILLATRRKKPR